MLQLIQLRLQAERCVISLMHFHIYSRMLLRNFQIGKNACFCIHSAFNYPMLSSYKALTSLSISPSASAGSSTTYAVVSGALPASLTLNSATGVISGTPSAVYPTATVTVKATPGSTYSGSTYSIGTSTGLPQLSFRLLSRSISTTLQTNLRWLRA